MNNINRVLIVGATGSIGRFAVEEALTQKYDVYALVRDAHRANFDDRVHVIEGDLTNYLTLDAMDAVIFTQGSYDSNMAESVDYNGVRNVLNALKGDLKRIALMTSIYSTADRENSHWKRRAERLVRASGMTYTIVRPSWFDNNQRDELALVLTQNSDKHCYTFTAKDGGVSRQQIAETLVLSLQTVNTMNRTISLFSTKGKRTQDFEALFASTLSDKKQNNFDGINDPNNLPIEQEPERVLLDLDAVRQ
ncbi:SDR family oxidoreductase [Utexia brackfieldae]|uniref:SDR family oxidoreductase n=1 Tax=Utexia brackfieldae TaxID=3074108 RepID=UPI00370DB1E1